jgi:hypothetical protein
MESFEFLTMMTKKNVFWYDAVYYGRILPMY